MITIDSVTKRRRGRLILDSVTFAAQPGRVTGFLGPNGAGKSSTLRILLGLDAATSGTALIAGRAYRDLAAPTASVGAMLDGASAHRSRTGRAHLRWIAKAAGVPCGRVEEVLAEVGLADASRQRVGRYSLGMAQRLGIAAALLGSPRALILDEPFNGLDPAGIVWLRRLLRAHADAGGTVLLSSHDMSEVSAIADDVVVIDQGRIAAYGPLRDLTVNGSSLEDDFFNLTGGTR